MVANPNEDIINQVKKHGIRSFRFNYYTRLLEKAAGFISYKHAAYAGKPVKDFSLLYICNEASFSMVKASLFSFLKHSDVLPAKVVIVSDGTWKADTGKKYFSSFKVPFEFDNWEACAIFYKNKGQEKLYTWAAKQIWGKKMAAILKYAESSLVLFSDPDILWYGNPIGEQDFKKTSLLKLSLDNSHNYDTDLIAKMNADYLYKQPPINCGVVLVKGDMFALSKNMIPAIEHESEKPGKFSEQTVFAMMANEFGETWPDTVVTANIKDILSPLFTKSKYPASLIARHYVWRLKWLYWRDVLTKI